MGQSFDLYWTLKQLFKRTDTITGSAIKEVVMGFNFPFAVIGERIKPLGRKLLTEEMKSGDYRCVNTDALA